MMNTKLLAVMVGVIVISACAVTQPGREITPESALIFPLPPAQPRIQYLTSFSSSSDLENDRNFNRFLFGSNWLSGERVIQKPYGLTVNKHKIYICDTQSGAIHILDLKSKDFSQFSPSGIGLLRKPVNLVIDKRGFLYVADTGRRQVVVYDSTLHYQGAISNDSLNPLDVEIIGDSLLIADYEDRNIEVYSLEEQQFLEPFPPNNGELPDSVRVYLPYALSSDQEHNIYVTDFGECRVQKFNQAGEFLASYGGIGRNPGQFARPKGIALDNENRLYVVDAMFENVQIFNEHARLLMFFGGHYEQPGNMYLPAQIEIDYENIQHFQEYVLPGYTAEFLIFVTNQYGPDKVSVYGFINPVN